MTTRSGFPRSRGVFRSPCSVFSRVITSVRGPFSVFPRYPHKVPGWVFRERRIRFQECLRSAFIVTCDRIHSNSCFGFLRKLRDEGWVLEGSRNPKFPQSVLNFAEAKMCAERGKERGWRFAESTENNSLSENVWGAQQQARFRSLGQFSGRQVGSRK